MHVSQIFLGLGEESFAQLLRSISLGKLKTFQLYERLKTRLHVQKLNSEALRKAAPRSWARLLEPDSDDFATELSQAILISHLDLIKAVLDHLAIPHEDGFFAKDLDPSKHLADGWQQSTSGARALSDLPRAARAYLDRIESLSEAPIKYVSVGTRRDQIIGA